MAKKLRTLLEEHSDTLAESLVTALRSSDAEHYQGTEPKLLRKRVKRVIRKFVAAMDGKGAPFTDYILALTEERIAEGYYLSEVQTLLNALDEQACAIAMDHAPTERLDRYLLRICHTVSRAKDAIAYAYFVHKQQAEERLESISAESPQPSEDEDGQTGDDQA